MNLRLNESSRLHERMKFFMKKNKITAKFISSKIGVTKGAVTHWSNGIRFIKDDMLITDIANILNINIVDLFPNSNKNRREITIDELKNNLGNYLEYIPTTPLPSHVKRVPFCHGDPTSNKIILENNMHNAEHIFIDTKMLPKEYQEVTNLKAMVMLGEAMTPYLNHGDVAIYSPTRSYSNKGRYIINSQDGLEIINVEKLKKCGSLVLTPENSIYTTETFSKEEQDLIEFVGLVIARISRR